LQSGTAAPPGRQARGLLQIRRAHRIRQTWAVQHSHPRSADHIACDGRFPFVAASW